MQCVILAGGLGTRMKPFTADAPKSMLEVSGRPFLEHQLGLLERNGVKEAVLCIGYLAERIEEYFGRGEEVGVAITYSREEKRLLGTAGALKRAASLLGEDFFVLYGDSYPDISFKEVYESCPGCGCPILMTVYRNGNRWGRSNAVFEGGRVTVFDKEKNIEGMEYIDYGLSVFSRKVLEEIPEGRPSNLAELYGKLAREGRLAGREVFKRFYEVGSPEGLKDFRAYLKENG